MPTVSQHYGHHAASWADDKALATRQTAAPVVLMVSGGADSTALLLMACTSKLDIQDGRGVAPIALCRGAEVCSRTLRPDGGTANGGSYLHRAHVFGSRGNVFDERD